MCSYLLYFCIVNKSTNQFTAKLEINTDMTTIQIRKNRKITDILRGMDVGEVISIKGSKDSVKQIASRLKKEGLIFTTSAKDIKNGLKIERVG